MMAISTTRMGTDGIKSGFGGGKRPILIGKPLWDPRVHAPIFLMTLSRVII